MNVTLVEKAKMVCLKCLRVTIETPSCCSAISTEQCSSIKLYSNRMDFIVVFYLSIVCYTSILEFQSEDSIHIIPVPQPIQACQLFCAPCMNLSKIQHCGQLAHKVVNLYKLNLVLKF